MASRGIRTKSDRSRGGRRGRLDLKGQPSGETICSAPCLSPRRRATPRGPFDFRRSAMLARSMFVLAMLGSAAPAWAFGIGTTAGIGAGGALFGGGPGTGRAVGSTWSGFLPTLDLHFGDIA